MTTQFKLLRRGRVRCRTGFTTIGASVCFSLALLMASTIVTGQNQQQIPENLQSSAPLDSLPQESWVDNFTFANIERFLQQGNLLLETGDYAQAEAAFQMAFQINRTNFGLFNPDQIEIIDRLLHALYLQNKWPAFDQQLAYLDSLNYKTLNTNAEQLAENLVSQSDWYRAAAAAIPNSRSAWYLIRAKYLNWQAVNVLEQGFGKLDIRLVPLLYRIVLDHHFQSVMNQRQLLNSVEYKTNGNMIENGWSLSKNESTRRSYRIGLENLNRIRSIYAASDQGSDVINAMLLLHIADWNLLFDYSANAAVGYQQAYAELISAGVGLEELDNYFSRAVVLPLMTLDLKLESESVWDNESSVNFQAWSNIYPSAQTPPELVLRNRSPIPNQALTRATVQLKLELQQEGHGVGSEFDYRVTGIDVVDYEPENGEILSAIFSEIPLLQFRPNIVNGQLTNHEPVFLNYVFPPI